MMNQFKISINHFFYTVLLIIFSTNIAVFLDIPVIRPVLGIIFLTIFPGLSIVLIMKLEKLSFLEKSLIAIGLSITFIMIFGLSINILLTLFGVEKPLSIFYLIISFTIIILIFFIIAYIKNKNLKYFEITSFLKIDHRAKIFLLIPLFLLFISILGTYILNTTNNNIFLMCFYLLVTIYICSITLSNDKIPNKIYPIIILILGISLQLVFALRSNHILGSDVHTEYYIFQQTFNNGRWPVVGNDNILNSCLSISILPTIYQSFLNINSEYLFKLLYPLIFSIAPIVVYLISKKYISNPYAFLTSIFFMSQTYFLFSGLSPRTIFAILFFALAIGILFFDKLSEFNRKLLFIIFSAGCIISHYATTYIFFIALLLTWAGFLIFRQSIKFRNKTFLLENTSTKNKNLNLLNSSYISDGTPPKLKSHITLGIVVIFFTLIFFWYSQITGSVFNYGVKFFTKTLNNLQYFFILESRGTQVSTAVGSNPDVYTIPYMTRFIVSWLTIAFIAIGILTILFRYRYTVNFSSRMESRTQESLSRKLDSDFFILSFVCSAILMVCTILPFVFIGYDMMRTYFQMMVLLSFFFVIGAIKISRMIHFKRAYLMAFIILILFFMSNNGIIYQISGVPQEITLNSEGQHYDMMYIHEQEPFAAKWLKDHGQENHNIYTDWVGRGNLISQGMIQNPRYLYLIDGGKSPREGYIYLPYVAVVDHKLLDKDYLWHNLTNYEKEFNSLILIYSNGGSAIYN